METGDDLPRPVLVLGATGGQGGAVAAALTQAGRLVRAQVRDLASPAAAKLAAAGAELTVAEFTDTGALTVAIRGTAAAFTLTTPFESGAVQDAGAGQVLAVLSLYDNPAAGLHEDASARLCELLVFAAARACAGPSPVRPA